MTIKVNGVDREVADGATVADVLAGMGLAPNGLAVAVDGEVVPRADHAATALGDGAVVEILTAVQGG